jgi:hypothetical protein
LPADIVFHENRYHEPTAEDLEHCYEAMAGATYAGGWFNSLSQYFMAGQEYEAREKHWQSALARQGFKASV